MSLVIMGACGSAHHWARWLGGLGIDVKLLPAKYVRAYVKRNKTDKADAFNVLRLSLDGGETKRCGAMSGADAQPAKDNAKDNRAIKTVLIFDVITEMGT